MNHTNKNEIDNCNNNILECGTSLAEYEYDTLMITEEDEIQVQVSATNDDNDDDDTKDGTVVDSNSRKKQPQLFTYNGIGSTILDNKHNNINTIESLRSFLLFDVSQQLLNDGTNGIITYFSSPFEDKRITNNKNSTTSTSTSTSISKKTYYKVPLIYCDQTASNRSIDSIENYIRINVLPFYGNTHTNTSITGSQCTAYVNETRQIISEYYNARITGKASTDTILFTGSGSTSCIQLLIDCIGLLTIVQQSHKNSTSNRPIVFIGPYEHHSNIIPWRESGCEIIMIPEYNDSTTSTGGTGIDIQYLESIVQEKFVENNNRWMAGTFTAASNVTGKVISNIHTIASILHKYNAYCFIDYATAASYIPINMNPTTTSSTTSTTNTTTSTGSNNKEYLDAIIISSHKLVGGINTPGILLIKKQLINQYKAPTRSGGGTVFYVTNTHHRFLSNRIERYEGGTPNIIGIIRIGLVYLLHRQLNTYYSKHVSLQEQEQQKQQQQDDKEKVQQQILHQLTYNTIPPTIHEYDYQTHTYITSYLQQHAPNIVLLGNDGWKNTSNFNNNSSDSSDKKYLPIFSFLIKFQKRFLHYNYVCALLNDIFGIQSRGGCQCAGPYSQRLLGLSCRNSDSNTNNKNNNNNVIDVPNEQNYYIEHALINYKERAELLRPGYTRLSLPYKGLSSNMVQYVLQALVWVSNNGWKLLCQYRCSHKTGEWRHYNRQGKPLGRVGERKWLSHYNIFNTNNQNDDNNDTTCSTSASSSKSSDDMSIKCEKIDLILQQALDNAETILQNALADHKSIVETSKMADNMMTTTMTTTSPTASTIISTEADTLIEQLRWYVYPKECAQLLLMRKNNNNSNDKSSTALDVNIEQNYSKYETLGAIRPNGGYIGVPKIYNHNDDIHNDNLHKVSNQDTPSSLTTTCTVLTMDVGNTNKRKDNNDDDNDTVHAHSNEIVPTANKIQSTEQTMMKRQKKEARGTSQWGHQGANDVIADDMMTNSTSIAIKEATNVSAVPPTAIVSAVPSTTNVSVPSTASSGNNTVPVKAKKFRHEKPPPKIMRLATQAVMQWEMIKDGDKLLLGLSGGKDSLSLLHCLLELKRILPIKFEIEVCTIDPMTPSFDPSPLIPYVESLGIKYHYIRDDIVDRANKSGKDGKMVASLCSFCARMKRGNLYSCARKNNCNKLVLAQHLDDCAESFMMSVMHNGFLRTMKAHYVIDSGDLAVIRPLIYCRESLMTDFAKLVNLPVINENCPACFEEPKERARMKKLLNREESLHPNFYDCIRRSLIPLMHDDLSPILRVYTEDVVSKSRSTNHKRPLKNQDTDSTTNGKKESPRSILSDHLSTRANVSSLENFSDDELIRELARRKANRSKMATTKVNGDPTGQYCTRDGANGSIPCSELME